MRKKFLWLCFVIALIGILSTCIMVLNKRAYKISAQEAEELLLEHLIVINWWGPDYVLVPFDPIEGEIDNENCYRFEIRYKDNVKQVGGRLFAIFAITDGGDKIFWYDAANDEWIEQK